MRPGEHTPGPWSVDSVMSEALHDIILGYQIPGAGNPILIASVYNDEAGKYPTNKQANANCRLIAAAPDLLAACKSMLRTCGSSADWQGETHESLLLIEAAIAKVEGTS
jgi:hypothetical protein